MIVTTTTSVTTVLAASLGSVAASLTAVAVLVLLIFLVARVLMEPSENKKGQAVFANLNIAVLPLIFVFFTFVTEKVFRILFSF
ncbi:hypothetical protein ACFLTW_03355 [Chloroflexota bacterium]